MPRSNEQVLADYVEELNSIGIEIDAATLKKIAKQELEREEKALTYLENPFLWQYHIACPPRFRHQLGDLHREGLKFVQDGKKKKMILWPRGHVKSGVFTIGETLRRVVRNPDYRVLLDTFKWDNSKRFLAGIKGILGSQHCIELYGELMPPANSKYKNNESELTIVTRQNTAIKEPNFSASGMDKTQTSQHYDLIVLDDLMSRENITNDEQLDKCIMHYRDLLDLLDPGGEIWVIGTRWHHLDLYGYIDENFVDTKCKANGYIHIPPCTCTYDVSIREIMEDGKYIFGERFTDSYVAELEREKGPVEFALQYKNLPAAQELCWFQKPLVDKALIDPKEIDAIRNDLLWFMSIDPAESLETRADYTAIVAVGVDMHTGIWYVDYAKQMKVETPGFIEEAFYAHQLIKPAKFGMDLHTRKALSYVLKDAMIKRNHFFHIEELKLEKYGAGLMAKEVRIKRLLPMFQFGRIKINKTLKDLIDILYTIPASKSKDLPDALSYVMDLVPEGIGNTSDLARPRRIVRRARIGL